MKIWRSSSLLNSNTQSWMKENVESSKKVKIVFLLYPGLEPATSKLITFCPRTVDLSYQGIYILSKLPHLFRYIILKVSVAVTDVRNIARQAHDRLRLLANIPENLGNWVPQSDDLLRLGWLQKLLQWHGFLLRSVVEDEIFDDECLDDRLQASSCILGCS